MQLRCVQADSEVNFFLSYHVHEFNGWTVCAVHVDSPQITNVETVQSAAVSKLQ